MAVFYPWCVWGHARWLCNSTVYYFPGHFEAFLGGKFLHTQPHSFVFAPPLLSCLVYSLCSWTILDVIRVPFETENRSFITLSQGTEFISSHSSHRTTSWVDLDSFVFCFISFQSQPSVPSIFVSLVLAQCLAQCLTQKMCVLLVIRLDALLLLPLLVGLGQWWLCTPTPTRTIQNSDLDVQEWLAWLIGF